VQPQTVLRRPFPDFRQGGLSLLPAPAEHHVVVRVSRTIR
jgi:hypothetical protein